MSTCPHCGLPIEVVVIETEVRIPEKRIYLSLTRIQRRMFEIVQKAGSTGISASHVFDRLYADNINGGPLSLNVVHVQRTKMNERLREFGLKITTNKGHGSLWTLGKP